MSESKQRRADPELAPIVDQAVLTPSGRSIRRVQVAMAKVQGASAAAQAAQQVAQAEQSLMIEAVANLAEAEGWLLPKLPVINLDAEAGTITIMTADAYEIQQRREAAVGATGGAARGIAARERANGHLQRETAPASPGEASE